MAGFTQYLRKSADIQPRTYWWEFPFYTIISSAWQKFCLGNRPEDLAHIDTIEKRNWARHLAYLERLERFPLDKAEYYLRLKESRGVKAVRELAGITGENWSYIARILRTLELLKAIKDFLQATRATQLFCIFFICRNFWMSSGKGKSGCNGRGSESLSRN